MEGACQGRIPCSEAMHQIVLLRGINLGPRNRVAMPKLREALNDSGFEDARTYLQSGNVLLRSDVPAAALADQVAELIAAEFGLELEIVVRTRDELAEVIRRNPLGEVAVNPKRYQVTFLEREPDPQVMEKLERVRAAPERLEMIGREIYAWHPEGVARSKLAIQLGGRGLGVPATSRNWTTVMNLLAMADE